MRLSESRVKQAILHAEQNVRDSAIYYFSRSFSSDPDLIGLVLRAIEQYGRKQAFFAYSFLESIRHSDDSIRWLIQQIEIHEESDEENEDEDRYLDNLLSALCNADPSLLSAHKTEIDGMDNLDDYTRQAIEEQIDLPALGPDALWDELESLCRECEDDDWMDDEGYEFACRLVSALAPFGNRCSDRVLAVLRSEAEYTVMTEFAARLAGELRLEAAVPYLTEMLTKGDEGLSEECHWALIKIGTVSVVEHLVKSYGDSDPIQRLSIPSILENIHSDVSVRACLNFLATEQDPSMRGYLIQAILHNFSPQGIDPARNHVLNTPLDPCVLEVRSDLLTACTMMGVSFPEFDEWSEDSKNDAAFRKQWFAEHPMDFDLDDELDEDFADELDEVDEEAERPVPPMVRNHERTGRNDPCPCGSGNKFKNCCYSKTGMLAEPDASDASDVFSQGRPLSPRFPTGTLAYYGPDDVQTTKVVASIIKYEGAKPLIERWVGSNVMANPKAKRQMKEFFDKYKVRVVVATDGNIGCPHEEGPDFPVGQDCPFCPYWAGKQGSGVAE